MRAVTPSFGGSKVTHESEKGGVEALEGGQKSGDVPVGPMAPGHAVLEPAPCLAGTGVRDLEKAREFRRAEPAKAFHDVRGHAAGRTAQLIGKIKVPPSGPFSQQGVYLASELIGQLPRNEILVVLHTGWSSTPRATPVPETKGGKWQSLPLPLGVQPSIPELSEPSAPSEPSEPAGSF